VRAHAERRASRVVGAHDSPVGGQGASGSYRAYRGGEVACGSSLPAAAEDATVANHDTVAATRSIRSHAIPQVYNCSNEGGNFRYLQPCSKSFATCASIE
jgi:hypothetical protein